MIRKEQVASGNIDRDSRGGFLLVEVLATMTISALLLAALFSITSLTLRTSHRIERRTHEIEDRTRLLAAVTREIERAVPVRWAGKDGAFVFTGNRQNLAFAAEFPSPDGATEMRAVFIDGTGAITRRVASLGPAATSFDELATGQPETMSSGRYRLSFAYFARVADGREALVPTWADPRQFPLAIRATLSDTQGRTMAMRIKLNVDTEPGCGFPELGRCSLRPAKVDIVVTGLADGGGG